MKKTLIAILALGSFAVANDTMLTIGPGFTAYADITPATKTSGFGDISFITTTGIGDITLKNYILTFQFSSLNALTSGTDGLLRLQGGSGMSVRGGGNNELIIVQAYNNTKNLADSALTVSANDTIALTVSDEYEIAILSNITTGDYITMTNLKDTFTNAAAYSFGPSSKINVRTHFDKQQFNFGQVANLDGFSKEGVIKAATTGLVPEPATATLSLLALAALASRRKRH